MSTTQQTRPRPATHATANNRSETLDRLHSEMTALFGILPVPFMAGTSVPTSDAEIEAQFDNMPV